ncbi:MAG: UDP-N-acetylmuramoyl-L-alanine--D-glutamate ligase [Turicibacter sp.]|nr:UDP-N-acetylmuramoyl-L-alanine--D-glutamate ligase [Turicibacter sp.]
MNTDFASKNVLVCGLAKSGISAAKLLAAYGANVTAQDIKPTVDWQPEHPNIRLFLGRNPDEILTNFDLVVISPGVPFDLPFLQKARLLGIPVWGEVELAYTFRKTPIIAITGTNGKTTVTTLVGEIMRRINHKTVVVGNIGVPLCDCVAELDTDALIVAELSSFQLETVHDFSPEISAVLNISPDHLDRHKTMAIYKKMKARIYAKQIPEDYAVLNYDNPLTRSMLPACKTVFFSAVSGLAGKEAAVFLDDGIIKARMYGKNSEIVDLREINILPENALAAAAICLCADVEPTIIADVLRNFKGVEHRVEYVTTMDGVDFYNDSKATNIDSALKGLEMIQRPIILIGGGYDKQADFEPWVWAFFGKVKLLIVLGQTADKIIETCKLCGFTAFEKVSTLEDAVKLARKTAESGDTVLLSPACASWDMFRSYEERGKRFKEIALNQK